MPPPPRMHKPNATIILKKCNLLEKLLRNGKKKNIHKFVELVETNPLIYNTLHFEHYLRLATRSNIFRYSSDESKTNS